MNRDVGSTEWEIWRVTFGEKQAHQDGRGQKDARIKVMLASQ